MPGGGDDDVVAGQIARAQRLAIDPRIGEDRGDILGRVLPALLGQPGEICAKGPQVMAGYWNRPDETAKVMTADGFFRTGDIGVMSADGYTKIVDAIALVAAAGQR